MRGFEIAAVLLFASACSARLGGGNAGHADDDGSDVDAALGGDAAIEYDAAPDAPPDAPTCASGRVVWLAFDGVNISKASTSDATTLHASWTSHNTAEIPPYHQGSGTRQQDIDTITSYLQTTLAPYHITVTTTRPPVGPYVLVAFGGDRNDAGTQYTIAVNKLDCGDGNKNDVAWVTDDVSVTKAADYAIGAIGYGMGLTATTTTSDCMCGWGNSCQQTSSHCTISTAPLATTGECSGQNTETASTTFATFCD